MANKNITQLTPQTGSADTTSLFYTVTGGNTDRSLPLTVLFNNPTFTGNVSIPFTQTGSGAVAQTVQTKLQQTINVQDYGVIADGVTDFTAAIQNILNQNPGRIIQFPYTGNSYVINSTITQPAAPCSFIIDSGVVFSGTVAALPAAFTNPQQVNVGNYLVQTPAYANTNGASPLQIESLPTASFTGNSVGLYAASRAPLGNPAFTGLLWAGNFLTTLSASTGTYNGQVLELDLNNHYKNSAGYGMLITGLGEFNPTAAINIDRSNNTSDWQTGVWIKHFGTYGIHIDGSTSSAPKYGLSIGGMDSGHIRLTPLDSLNPTATMFAIQNSTGTSNMLTMAANGNISGAGATYTSATINGTLAVTGTVSGSGITALLAPYALLAGASFTGNIAVGTSSAHINVNDTSGTGSAYISYQNNGTVNWRTLSNNSTDVFTVDRFTSGSFTDSPISISGSTGVVSFIDGIAPSTTKGIVGTTLGDNANAGSVGEFISSTVLQGSSVNLTSNTAANITSISLTAGDWDVSGSVWFNPASTTTSGQQAGWISTTSATLPTAPGNGGEFNNSNTIPTNNGSFGFCVGPTRVNVSTTTTVYLSAQANFSASTMGAFGFIRARRVR